MSYDAMFKELETKIQQSYEEGITIPEAERLAGEFLHCQMMVSAEIKKADLSARMRKSGVKAIKAGVYMEAASKGDKRPTEAALAATVDMDETARDHQDDLDLAEVERDELERQYDILVNGHIFFRGIAKGNFS